MVMPGEQAMPPLKAFLPAARAAVVMVTLQGPRIDRPGLGREGEGEGSALLGFGADSALGGPCQAWH